MTAASGSKSRNAARALVLAAFATLMALGRLRFWAIALGLGLAAEALRPGRLYCMRLCPIRAVHGLAGAGSASRKKRNGLLRATGAIKAMGWAFIAEFLVLFGISLAFGWRGWLFPAYVGIGIILSFELSLLTMCSSFCPLGAAFVLVRRISRGISSLIGAASRKRLNRRGPARA